MKVFFDHQIFSIQRMGGISRAFVSKAEAMKTQNLADVRFPFPLSVNPFLKASPLFRGGRLPFSDTPRGRQATYRINRAWEAFHLRRGRFDILHTTFYRDDFREALGQKPFVMTVADMTPELRPDLFKGNPHLDKMALVDKAAGILVYAGEGRERLLDFRPDLRERVHVVPLAGGFPLAPKPEASLGLPDRYLLFVGNRGGYKNFQVLASAAEPLLHEDPDLHVLCVGGGPFTASEREGLRESGLEGRFLQRSLDDEGLARCYRGALAFVFPSFLEGFGLPVLEAYSQGCPLVLAEASCLPEVAGEAAWYFDPHKADSLTEALRRVLKDGAERHRRIDLGFKRLADFSWERTARETVAVYQKILP
ncbi:MAG: glycosyltransferase family 4 protein [Magnetovibrionaceae bacterium]